MQKNLTCIQCPKGCPLSIEIENGKVLKVSGNECAKGETYARQEIENPLRTLTSAVLAKGLELKMVPVKTNHPIPKSKLLEVMEVIKKHKLKKSVKVGGIIIKNIGGLKVDLIATRSAKYS